MVNDGTAREGLPDLGGWLGGLAPSAVSGPTPAFYYSRRVIRDRIAVAHDVFAGYDRFFSVKANPCPGVLREVHKAGLGFEVASGGELVAARHAGGDPKRMVRGGVGRTRGDFSQAIRLGFAVLVIDSPAELQRYLEAGTGRTRAVLRVAWPPGGERPDQFGFDGRALALAAPCRQVHGLHVYFSDVGIDAARVEAGIKAFIEVCHGFREAGGRLDCLMVGPGLSIPYREGAREPPAAAVAAAYAGLRRAIAPIWAGLEVGRFIVGPAGWYVVTVLDVKEVHQTRFLILDGGWNHLLRPVVTGEPFPVVNASRPPGGAEEEYVLAGPTCSPLDVLGRVRLPRTSAGDRLVFARVGAYGRTMAVAPFMSRGPASELVF